MDLDLEPIAGVTARPTHHNQILARAWEDALPDGSVVSAAWRLTHWTGERARPDWALLEAALF